MDQKYDFENSENEEDPESSLELIQTQIKALEHNLHHLSAQEDGMWNLLNVLNGVNSSFVSLVCCFVISNAFSKEQELPSRIKDQFDELSTEVLKSNLDVKFRKNTNQEDNEEKTTKLDVPTFQLIFLSIKNYFNKLKVLPITADDEESGNYDKMKQMKKKEDDKVSTLYPIFYFTCSFQSPLIEKKFLAIQRNRDIWLKPLLLIIIVLGVLIDNIVYFDIIGLISNVFLCLGMIVWIYYFHNSNFSQENIQDYDNIGNFIIGLSFIISIFPLMFHDMSGSEPDDLLSHSIPSLLKLALLPFLLINCSTQLKFAIHSLYYLFFMISLDNHNLLSGHLGFIITFFGYILSFLLNGFYEISKREQFAYHLYQQWELNLKLTYHKKLNYSNSKEDLVPQSSHALFNVTEVDEEEKNDETNDGSKSPKNSSSLDLELSLKTLQFSDEEIEQKFNKYRWGTGYVGRSFALFMLTFAILAFSTPNSTSDPKVLLFIIMRIFFSSILTFSSFMISSGRLVRSWGDVLYLTMFCFNLYRAIVVLSYDCENHPNIDECSIVPNFDNVIIVSVFSIVFSAYCQWIIVFVGQTILLVIIMLASSNYIKSISASYYLIMVILYLIVMIGRYMLEYGVRSSFSESYEENYLKNSDAAKYQEILKVIHGKVDRQKKSNQPYNSSLSGLLDSSDSDIDHEKSGQSRGGGLIEGSSHKILSSIVKEIDSAQRMNSRLSIPDKSVTSSYYELPTAIATKENDDSEDEKKSESNNSSNNTGGYHMSDDKVFYSTFEPKQNEDVEETYNQNTQKTIEDINEDQPYETNFGFDQRGLSFTPAECENAFIISRWGNGKYRRRVCLFFCTIVLLFTSAILIKDGLKGLEEKRSFFAGSLPLGFLQGLLYLWAPHTKTGKDKMLWSNLFFFSFFISTTADVVEVAFTASPGHCPEGHDTICAFADHDLPMPNHIVYCVIMPFIGLWAYWPLVFFFCIVKWGLNLMMLINLGAYYGFVFNICFSVGMIMLAVRWLIEYEQRLSFFTGWNTLKGVEQKYSYGRLILDAVGIPITVSDMEGNIEFTNDSFNLIFRYSSQDFQKDDELRETPNIYDILEGFGVHDPTPDYGLEAVGNGFSKTGEVIPILSSMKYLTFMGNMKMVHTIREMDFDTGMDDKNKKKRNMSII